MSIYLSRHKRRYHIFNLLGRVTVVFYLKKYPFYVWI